MKLQFSDLAKSHLQSIFRYTEETWGLTQARKYTKSLLAGIRRLSRNPQVGRSRDDLRKGLRSFCVEKHIVYYRILEKQIVINSILHGRMEPKLHLGE